MGTSAGPSNSTKSNLVFALDAADTNTITRWSTFKNMSTWSAGSGGASGYSQNGGTDENERVWATDPWGNSALVWESRPNGNGNDDGGWNADSFSIDNTKLYRLSVWVKRTSSTGGGTFYLGTNGIGQCVRRLSDGGLECNPYWHCGGTGGLTQNQWYLVVGHCFPYTYTSSTGHPDTGFWTVENGGQKVGSINGCNIGNDCKSDPDTYALNHRTYHYYCGDSTTRLQFYDPRADLVDGTEPKIRELLKGPTAATRNPVNNANIIGNLYNGVQLSKDGGGSFVFDGSNDYIASPESTVFDNQQVTVEVFVKPAAISQNGFWFEKGSVNTQYSLFMEGSNIVWRQAGDSQYTSTSFMTVNRWNHVVGTFKTGERRTYVNSVLRTSDTLSKTLATSGGNGEQFIGSYNSGGYYYNGSIAIVNVYNRVLTAEEIAQNYKKYQKRFNFDITLGTQSYPASSASDIKTANPDAQDGVYWFTIGGSTFQAPVMFHAGKAMICVMKGGGGNGFLPDDALWENNSTQNTTDFDLTNSVASKYASYHTVPLSEFYFKLGATNYPVTFKIATAASSMLAAQQRSWNDSGNRSTPHFGMNQDYRTVQGADAGITATMGTEIYMYGMDLKHEGHYGGGAGSSGGRIRAGSILDESTGNTGALSYGTAGSAFGIAVNGGNPLKTAVAGYAGWSESIVYASTAQWSLWVVS